ncbi:MDR family MFS transporter [Tepidibacillus fermentans]|uniref:Putative MFS family arabinose efflux permease n=1 Tax=Tepidibacillus fermentans TaxID=1281767 RepID=A0A4R3KJ76_9BACI|nr:MFS transporter [Tepidibacillus fermentans]TCS83698.1 putative MFS family arabinose efflux permease [Tepidibacillus fermentans]
MNLKHWDLNLRVRIIAETINSILFWMFFPFMTLYFIDQFGEQLTGTLMIIPPILGVIANLFGGSAADRFGRKRMMVFSLGVQAIALFIFAFSFSPWVDYLIFIGISMMGSIYHPASMAMVADLVPLEERRPIFAAFYTAVNLGVVIGPIIGSFFFFNYRQYMILISSMITFMIFIVMVKVLRETLPLTAKDSTKGRNLTAQLKNYMVIFTDRVFFLYMVAGILISQVFMQMDLYLGVYLKKYVPSQVMNLGFWEIQVTGEKLFGWMISENGLLVVLFTVWVSQKIKAWSDEKALIISSLLFGLSYWLIAFTTNVWILIGLMALFTLAELIRTPVIQNFITEMAPEDQRGQYLGASSLQFTIGRAIAPLAVTLAGFFQPRIILSGIFILSIISALLYKWMFIIYRKRQLEQGE